jgi:hypothetical protein
MVIPVAESGAEGPSVPTAAPGEPAFDPPVGAAAAVPEGIAWPAAGPAVETAALGWAAIAFGRTADPVTGMEGTWDWTLGRTGATESTGPVPAGFADDLAGAMADPPEPSCGDPAPVGLDPAPVPEARDGLSTGPGLPPISRAIDPAARGKSVDTGALLRGAASGATTLISGLNSAAPPVAIGVLGRSAIARGPAPSAAKDALAIAADSKMPMPRLSHASESLTMLRASIPSMAEILRIERSRRRLADRGGWLMA